jgi:hypothetical protein
MERAGMARSAFQDRCLKPLGHPSCFKYINALSQRRPRTIQQRHLSPANLVLWYDVRWFAPAQEWQAILRLREEVASLHVALPAARFRAEQDDHHAR